MTTPFTYCITHIPSGKRYYGVRYKDGCHPSDLWNKYFTSSKIIRKMINEDGLASFDVEIRKIFTSKDAACKWETTVLRRMRVTESENWINQSYGTPPKLISHSETSKKKISQSLKDGYDSGHIKPSMGMRGKKQRPGFAKGASNPFFGRTHSAESLQKMRENRKSTKGYRLSEETKKKISDVKKGKPFTGYGGNDPEVRERARQTMIGMKRSPESRERMRQARLAYINRQKEQNE